MFGGFSRTALGAVCGAMSSIAAAQAVEPAAEANSPLLAEALPPTVTPAPADLKLPALSVVELTVVDEVSSKTAITGQPVKLALASPLYLTSDLGLPAGTPVEGVVIHSARPGMGGKAGELLIGAKRIHLSQMVEIPLRSFKLTPARGKNNEAIAFGATVAGGAIGGVAAMFITGGSATAPAGASAAAKTAAEVSIPMALLSKLPPRASDPALTAPPPPIAFQAATTTTNQGNPK